VGDVRCVKDESAVTAAAAVAGDSEALASDRLTYSCRVVITRKHYDDSTTIARRALTIVIRSAVVAEIYTFPPSLSSGKKRINSHP